MADGAEPLVLAGRAARRLQLLLGHGARPGGSAAAAPGAPEAPRLLRLEAGVLHAPVQLAAGVAEGTGEAWQRDPLAEVAVHLDTLRALKVPAGSLVEVRNAARPDLPRHLARVLPSPASAPGAALLAPGLAYNLGLALHLRPLLQGHGTGTAAGAAERVLLAPYTSPPAAPGNGHSQRSMLVPQPSAEPAAVPLAEALQLAVVYTPAETLLTEAPGPRSPASQPGVASEAAAGEAGAGAAGGGGTGGGEEQQEAAVQALQHFFLAAPRLVCQGDVLAVPRRQAAPSAATLPNLLQPPGAAAQQGAAEQGGADAGAAGSQSVHQQQRQQREQAAPCDVLYVRVVRALPDACGPLMVDAESTQIQLGGRCRSGIPPALPAYLDAWTREGAQPDAAMQRAARQGRRQHAQLAAEDSQPAPPWWQLAELLASALHPQGHDLPLRLAVLLHGPAGSGRRAMVRAAAAAVGCHVVWLSAHDLRAPGRQEKGVLESLQAAFEHAGRYRPAVLALRHFEALGGDFGGGPGGGDSFAARLGTVLAECVRAGFQPDGGQHQPLGGGAVVDDGSLLPAGGASDAGELSAPFPAPLVLVACSTSPDSVPAPLRRCFTHELAAEAPDQAARQALLARALSRAGGDGLGEEALEELARHTAGLLPREVRAVVADAAALAAGAALPPTQPSSHLVSPETESGVVVEERHLVQALDAVRARSAADIGAPKIPNVKWEDVGGLEDVKAAILDTVELPLKHPELFSGGLRRRSGVLLYGPPGTGKTLLAKAVATECSINFLSVKGPELINMYVGESERQIREVFARARRARPCVVFFDELDSLAPARGKGSDSGGVMDRVVAQLLAEIDGVQGGAGGSGDMFVIGATNRPDLLDTALMRPGRLDRLLYVGITGDATSRLRVLQALTRKFVLHPDVDLAEVAERCPARFTGADMYALCSDAWMTALRRGITGGTQVAGGHGSIGATEGADREVMVTQSDFTAALASLQPSLSLEEVRKYEAIRDQYQAQRKL